MPPVVVRHTLQAMEATTPVPMSHWVPTNESLSRPEKGPNLFAVSSRVSEPMPMKAAESIEAFPTGGLIPGNSDAGV